MIHNLKSLNVSSKRDAINTAKEYINKNNIRFNHGDVVILGAYCDSIDYSRIFSVHGKFVANTKSNPIPLEISFPDFDFDYFFKVNAKDCTLNCPINVNLSRFELSKIKECKISNLVVLCHNKLSIYDDGYDPVSREIQYITFDYENIKYYILGRNLKPLKEVNRFYSRVICLRCDAYYYHLTLIEKPETLNSYILYLDARNVY